MRGRAESIADSEAGLIRGLTVTTAEAGKVAGACAVAAGAGPRVLGGFSTHGAEGGTFATAGIRGGAFPMPSGAGVAGQANPKLLSAPRRINYY